MVPSRLRTMPMQRMAAKARRTRLQAMVVSSIEVLGEGRDAAESNQAQLVRGGLPIAGESVTIAQAASR